jgi:hypothetical protein
MGAVVAVTVGLGVGVVLGADVAVAVAAAGVAVAVANSVVVAVAVAVAISVAAPVAVNVALSPAAAAISGATGSFSGGAGVAVISTPVAVTVGVGSKGGNVAATVAESPPAGWATTAADSAGSSPATACGTDVAVGGGWPAGAVAIAAVSSVTGSMVASSKAVTVVGVPSAVPGACSRVSTRKYQSAATSTSAPAAIPVINAPRRRAVPVAPVDGVPAGGSGLAEA